MAEMVGGEALGDVLDERAGRPLQSSPPQVSRMGSSIRSTGITVRGSTAAVGTRKLRYGT
jgi:hypothetical protein